MKEIVARAGIVVAFMAAAAIVIVAMPNRAPEQPTAAQTITAAVECSPLDISCHAAKTIEQQKAAEPEPAVEPMCKETEDYDNGYTCALVTETGPVYATAPSTCPAEETRGLLNSMAGFIRCTGDAQAATIAAAQGQTVIPWERSDYNGANAWNLWGGI